MSDQLGFFFDAPLTKTPASQLPPPRVLEPQSVELRELLQMSGCALVAYLVGLTKELPDDISYDDLLDAAGFTSQSLTGWHRARAMEALLAPEGEYQAYIPKPGQVRFKRLPPLEPCRGEGCGKPTRGGVLCVGCRAIEEEDLWNQE